MLPSLIPGNPGVTGGSTTLGLGDGSAVTLIGVTRVDVGVFG